MVQSNSARRVRATDSKSVPPFNSNRRWVGHGRDGRRVCARALRKARADTPFFQAFQSPTPTLASTYPSAAAPSSEIVGTPLPPVIETDTAVPTYGSPSFQTGIVSSTITDQPAAAPVPLNILDPSTYFAADSSLLMPWDRGPAACTDCRTDGLVLFHNYSSWRGISEGTGSNNNGFAYGFNYGTKLGVLSDYTGIGGRSAAAMACMT